MEFPSGGDGDLEELRDELVAVSTGRTRDIYVSVLGPWAKVERNQDSGWQVGEAALRVQDGRWREDLGTADQGHLVVVNDTRITSNLDWSERPSIAIDSEGHTHLAWMDGRDHGARQADPREVYHIELDLRAGGTWDGGVWGLDPEAIKLSEPRRVSNLTIERPSNPPGRWDGSSLLPALMIDASDRPHVVWVDQGNASLGETLMHARLEYTNLSGWIVTSRLPITDWSSDELGPNTGLRPASGTIPSIASSGGGGLQVAWSDTNLCGPAEHGPRYTLCGTAVLTGLIRVRQAPGEPPLKVVEPGGQANWTVRVSNEAPGPPTEVADNLTLSLDGVPLGWQVRLRDAANAPVVYGPATVLHLLGGQSVDVVIEVTPPPAYLAVEDEWAEILVVATSLRDPAVRDALLTRTLMDVRRGLELDATSAQAAVRQGETAIFHLQVTNSGNVNELVGMNDASTRAGRLAWQFPVGWSVEAFEQPIDLRPGEASSFFLRIAIPTWQTGTQERIVASVTSLTDPNDPPASASIILWLDVREDVSSKLRVDADESTVLVRPGECARWPVQVYKGEVPALLQFWMPDAPEPLPAEVDPVEWRRTNWIASLDFSLAPGGNQLGAYEPRHWSRDATHIVDLVMCSPTEVRTGPGPAITLQVTQVDSPDINDQVLLSAHVAQVFDLEFGLPLSERII